MTRTRNRLYIFWIACILLFTLAEALASVNTSGEAVNCSLWDSHQREWIGVMVLIILEAAAIILLLIQLKRRRKAERLLKSAHEALKRRIEDQTLQFEQASRDKIDFLTRMSHEVRTPMNAILGFSETLFSKTRDPDHRHYLEIILSSGRSLFVLINDFLDQSKIEAGYLSANTPISIPPEIDGNIVFEPAAILVTDDVQENRSLIRAYLKDTQLSVMEAESGEQTLSMLSQGGIEPGVILMDLRIPKPDGWETARKIKESKAWRHIPVIAFTAKAMQGDMESITALFDGALFKPLNRRALLAELKRFLAVKTGGGAADSGGRPPDNRPVEPVLEISPELAAAMEKEMLPVWKENEDVWYIDSAVEFAERLKEISEAHENDRLGEYAADLSRAAQNNRIDEMERLIKVFPDLMNACGGDWSEQRHPVIPPPAGALRKLREMAELGLMDRVEAYSASLVEKDARYSDFDKKIKELAGNFEDRRLIELIDGFMRCV